MTVHLKTEDLLDVRDGEGTAEAEAHARSCSRCSEEIEALRDVAESLRSLPALQPESDRWPQVRREFVGDRQQTMHLRTEELLEVRDGEGAAAALAHVDSCPECSEEIESLRSVAQSLRSLPDLQQESDQWPQVRQAFLVDRRRRKGAAIGASLAVAASLAILLIFPPSFRQTVSVPAGGQGVERIAVSDLMEESRQLEEMLRSVSPRGRVMDAWEANAASDLEYELGLIDGRLGRVQSVRLTPVESNRLWEKRVNLMNELVRVRGARPAYVGL
jgi:hypothetical protein